MIKDNIKNTLRGSEEFNEILGQRFYKTMQNLQEHPKQRNYIQINGEQSIYVEGKSEFPITDFRGFFIGTTGRARSLEKLRAILILQNKRGLFVERANNNAYCWGFKNNNSPKFSLLIWFKTYHEEKLVWVTADGFMHIISDILCDDDNARLFDFFEPICNQYFKEIESETVRLSNEKAIDTAYELLEGFQTDSNERRQEINDYWL